MIKIIMAILFTLCLCVSSHAIDMVWDYDQDHKYADGYTVYYSDNDETYNKTFIIDEIVVDNNKLVIPNIDSKLNLQPGIEYEFYLTRYNDAGESDPSNIVQYSVDTYVPPEDMIPPIIINIPGPIQITIGD